MADNKITELSQLGIADYTDLFVLVDVSAYETKNITVSNLMGSPGSIGINNADSGKFTTLQLLNGISVNEISLDITLGGDSDLVIPTERAVKTYIDNSIIAIVIEHNDTLNIQGGDSTANDYYHLSNQQYTFLSTLTNEHNDTLNIQGGNSGLDEYYHLDYERYTFLSTLTNEHNDTLNIQGGNSGLDEYYHLDYDRYTFLSTLTNNHNDTLNIQGGNLGLDEYYHLSNQQYTFLSTLTNEHNDTLNIQGGNSGLDEYYHLDYERYIFLSTLTNNHNDTLNIQGGDSTANDYYHLSNQQYTFLSTLTNEHNDTLNIQGGNSGLDEYYHLSNQQYTFLSTLTNNHNDTLNIQGGDSTVNDYYHLNKFIYDNLFYDSSILVGIGNNLTTNIKLNLEDNTIIGFISNIPEVIIDIDGLALKVGRSVNKISNDGNFLDNSVSSLVTERAIKAYVDLNSGGSNNDIVIRVSSDSTAVAHNVLLVDTTSSDINIKMLDILDGRITIKKISNDLNRVIITSIKNIDGLSQYIINTPNQSYNFLVDSGDFFVI